MLQEQTRQVNAAAIDGELQGVAVGQRIGARVEQRFCEREKSLFNRHLQGAATARLLSLRRIERLARFDPCSDEFQIAGSAGLHQRK